MMKIKVENNLTAFQSIMENRIEYLRKTRFSFNITLGHNKKS